MLRIEKTEDKQFPYIIHGIGGGRPQEFTDKALKELHKLISAEISIHNSEYKQCYYCQGDKDVTLKSAGNTCCPECKREL